MSGILSPIKDILNLLQSIEGITHARIWNNQVKYEKDSTGSAYPKPAAFLEVINNVEYQQLGQGVQSADVGWRVHLVTEFYDAGDGTMDQDIAIFDLRDKTVNALALTKPTGCGPLVRTAEGQDYEHDNVYHYIIEFVCNFIDYKGSPHDPDTSKFIEKDVPTTLQVNFTTS